MIRFTNLQSKSKMISDSVCFRSMSITMLLSRSMLLRTTTITMMTMIMIIVLFSSTISSSSDYNSVQTKKHQQDEKGDMILQEPAIRSVGKWYVWRLYYWWIWTPISSQRCFYSFFNTNCNRYMRKVHIHQFSNWYY